MQKEIDKSITVENVNTFLLIIDRTTRQKTSKDKEDLHNTNKQAGLFDIYMTLTQQQCNTSFLQVHVGHLPKWTI